MLERETLTCRLASGLLSSWRVAALTFVMGISHFLVLSHSRVPLPHLSCLVLAPVMLFLQPVPGAASSPGIATPVLLGHRGMVPHSGAVLSAIALHCRSD